MSECVHACRGRRRARHTKNGVMLICPTPHSFKTYHDGQTVQTHVSHGFGLECGGASNACGVDVGGFVVSGVRTRRGRLHSRGKVCWVSCSSPSPGLRTPAPWGAEESGGVLVVPVALCLPVCVCLCVCSVWASSQIKNDGEAARCFRCARAASAKGKGRWQLTIPHTAHHTHRARARSIEEERQGRGEWSCQAAAAFA